MICYRSECERSVILKKYFDVIDDNSKRLIDTLQKQDDDTVIDLMPTFTNYTLKIICESMLGVALDRIDKKSAQDYQDAISTMCGIVAYRSDYAFHTRLDDEANFQNHAAIATRCIGMSQHIYGQSGRKKLAMLDLLIKAEINGSIDKEGIKEEFDISTFGGHDTTGSALVIAISLLAEHKDIQEKARAEVTKILDRTKGNMGTAELQEFNYLDRCIKESLRLYPTVPMMSRTIQEDLTLRGYVIPAGTDVVVQFVDLHRDPNFWPDPEKYDPDRFLPEKSQGRHPYSYVPFSAGPRSCLGQKFAMMSIKCTLARILYDFRLEPVEKISDVKMELQLINRPSTPVHVKFGRIDRSS